MRIGAIICAVLFVTWITLALIQLWAKNMDPDIFMKLTITLGGLFLATLAVSLAMREYINEKKMKDDGYID